MPRFSSKEIEDIRQFLFEGNVDAALAIYRVQYPLTDGKVFHDLGKDEVERILSIEPPSLSFMSASDVTEVKTLAAITVMVGRGTKPDKLYRDGFVWTHKMSPRAAINTVIGHANWIRDRDRLGVHADGRIWRYLHTCDPGTCDACLAASRYLYRLSDFPGGPVPNCTNLEDGCRCLPINQDPQEMVELLRKGFVQFGD